MENKALKLCKNNDGEGLRQFLENLKEDEVIYDLFCVFNIIKRNIGFLDCQDSATFRIYKVI